MLYTLRRTSIMLITINGPYEKFNQIVASRVNVEVQKLYKDINVFLYKNDNKSQVDKMILNKDPDYNPFVHISKILSQMALDLVETEGDNKPVDTCIRDYLNTDRKLLITTEWYSSAIIRVLSNLTPYETKTNLADILARKDELVDFAFNLVKHFQFISPDLNIILIPNEMEMEEDIKHQVISTRSLTKKQAEQIRQCYKNYMQLLINDPYNLFTRNGEDYVPVCVLNRSNITLLNRGKKPTTNNLYSKRYQAFEKQITNQKLNIKSQKEVVEDIINIIKTYVDIVQESNQQYHNQMQL